MDFNCPGCNKSGNIDDTKMTESGVYATCPQCKNKFLIKPEASKDFVYETVVQAESQQASLEPPAATTQIGEDSSIPADTIDAQKPLKISANTETSRISTKPLEFFFSFLLVSSVRLASDLSVRLGLQLGAILVGLLALCGILLGWLVGKFIGEKLNVSRLQRTHKIFSAWAICITSFVILIAFFTVAGVLQQKISVPNSNPPVRTTSQPEYSQPQITETSAPIPAPSPSTVKFIVQDDCNDGIAVQYRFFDVSNNLCWPSIDMVYKTNQYKTPNVHKLSCKPGANICFGATTYSASPTVNWGVGINNDQVTNLDTSCVNCGSVTKKYFNLSCPDNNNLQNTFGTNKNKKLKSRVDMYQPSPSGNRRATTNATSKSDNSEFNYNNNVIKEPTYQTVKKSVDFSELSPSQQQSLELSCFEARAKGQLQFDECIKAKLSSYK